VESARIELRAFQTKPVISLEEAGVVAGGVVEVEIGPAGGV